MPTWQSTMHLYPIDGAAHDVGPEDTPWSYRDAHWASVFAGVDPAAENAGTIKDWTVGYFDALHPHSAGGAYVNMMMDEGQERVRASYRDNYGAAGADQGRVRPGEPVPGESEHPAGGVGRRWRGRAARVAFTACVHGLGGGTEATAVPAGRRHGW